MPDNFTTTGRDLVGQVIDNGRWELVSILGVGAYGVVYLGVDTRARARNPAGPQQYVAVKCLSRKGLDQRQRHFQRREIALHQLASGHPSIAGVHKVIEEDRYIFVVLDYCPGGDLFSMITERQRYVGDDELVRLVFLQIIDAVAYCHSMGIFHRDLKPENILCNANGTRVYVADFGLATTERMSTDFGCGSTFYLSPECQGGLFDPVDAYSTAQADLWSLGVILVNLACGRNPWRQACADDDTFRAYLEDPTVLGSILPLSTWSTSILARLFAQNPADRISLAQLRAMVVAAPSFSTTPRRILPSPPQSPQLVDPCLSAMAVTSHWSHDEYSDRLERLPTTDMSPTSSYAALPARHPFAKFAYEGGTPASTPGLVDSSMDPFYSGQHGRTLSTSTIGSVPPTPELGATTINSIVPTLAPAPEPRWVKKARREAQVNGHHHHHHHHPDDVEVELLGSTAYVI